MKNKIGRRCSRPNQHLARRGSLLIITLVTLVILSLSAYTFTELMQTEEQAARLMTRRVQSKYLVDSGVDFTRLFLTNGDAAIREKGGLWDNPNLQNIVVAIDPNRPEITGRFTIVAPGMDEEGVPEGFRYGLIDESSKINLSILPYADVLVGEGAARGFLLNLPEMTDDIADAIIDWVDKDDEAREYGAESSYYEGLNPPYQCKNAPMDSLEELLLVRGVTPELLYGADTNRNGVIDPIELNDPNLSALDNDMLLGWANYLTLFSKESNLTEDFLPRININGTELEQLYDDLRSVFDETWARFIINYRINGPAQPRANQEIQDGAFFAIDFSKESQFTFTSVLDLVDAYTTAFNPDDLNDEALLQSPIRMENLPFTMPIVMKNLTTNAGTTIPGRINIMQAPARVMAGIPGMTPELLDVILQVREFELDDPEGVDLNRQFETWLLVESRVELDTMKTMLPYICTGGDVYRAEVVGYFDDGIATSRCEAVIDTTIPIPRLLFWRDKSFLQAGYSIDVLGVDLNQQE